MPSISASIRSRLGSSVIANDPCCQIVHSTKCHVEGLVCSRLIMLAHCALVLYSSICALIHNNVAVSVTVGLIILFEAADLIVRNDGVDFYW